MFVLPSVEALHSCASLCCSTQEDAINLLVFLAPHLWENIYYCVTAVAPTRKSVRYNAVKRTTEVVCGYKRQS